MQHCIGVLVCSFPEIVTAKLNYHKHITTLGNKVLKLPFQNITNSIPSNGLIASNSIRPFNNYRPDECCCRRRIS